jgi:hypothetical protein
MTTPTCSRPSTDSPSRRRSGRARGATAAAALLLLSSPSVGPLSGGGTAHAQEAEGFRARYDRGIALYNTGQYDRAIEEFRGAYELKQVPIILFSLAQAHRKAGHHKEAIELYDRFLATDPKEPIKTEAQKFSDESKAALQAQDEEKRKAEEKIAADKAAADKAAADKAAAELAEQQAAFRKKYGPGRPLNIAKWALGGAGLAAVIAGAALMAVDGQPTCALGPGQRLCPEQLDTLLTGGVVLGGGVLLLGGSAALFVLDYKQMRDRAPRPAAPPAEPGDPGDGRDPDGALLGEVLMRSHLSRNRTHAALLLGLGLVLGPLSLGAGCTRATPGFCQADPDCSLGSYCALPAQECTKATIVRAELSGGQQVPPTASNATGSLKIIVSPDGSSGAWTLAHTVKNATFAELRFGKVGQGNMGGLPLATLPPNQQEGTLPLDPDKIRSLTAGEVYLVVGSSSFQTGEVRGQLYSIDPQHQSGTFKLTGLLSGLQNSPANGSKGRGTIGVTYDDVAGTLAYSYSISGIVGSITGLHLHRGAFNVNGPHVVDMPSTEAMSSGTLTRDSICTQHKDQCQLAPVLIKSGLLYFNVHTSEVAGGELRAQLQVNGSLPFNTPISSQGFTPPVSSPALGEVHFYLSEDKARLAYRIEHNAANPTALELFKPGAMGAPVKVPCSGLDASKGLSGAQGYCDVTADAANTTAIQQSDLLSGVVSVVLKTMANPTGELRGDVRVPR